MTFWLTVGVDNQLNKKGSIYIIGNVYIYLHIYVCISLVCVHNTEDDVLELWLWRHVFNCKGIFSVCAPLVSILYCIPTFTQNDIFHYTFFQHAGKKSSFIFCVYRPQLYEFWSNINRRKHTAYGCCVPIHYILYICTCTMHVYNLIIKCIYFLNVYRIGVGR